MGTPEKLSLNFVERSAKVREREQKKRELKAKMRAIKLFPGSLKEFIEQEGAEYELIKLPDNQAFLEGGLGEWLPAWVPVDRQGENHVRIIDAFNPLNWKEIGRVLLNLSSPDYYREILVKAVELGADALIDFKRSGGGYDAVRDSRIPIRETGVPIKPVDKPTRSTQDPPEGDGLPKPPDDLEPSPVPSVPPPSLPGQIREAEAAVPVRKPV